MTRRKNFAWQEEQLRELEKYRARYWRNVFGVFAFGTAAMVILWIVSHK